MNEEKYLFRSFICIYRKKDLSLRLNFIVKLLMNNITSMKKLFLLFAFCSVAVLQAIAAPIQANQWNVLKFRASLSNDEVEAIIFEYTMLGDTTINDTTYTKIMERETLTSKRKRYVAAIRQEQDKVYVNYDNIEYLLYDFNAKVGDEIIAFGGLDHPTTLCKNTVTDVHITENGQRILTVRIIEVGDDDKEFQEEAQWIEGIGSSHGLLHTGVAYCCGFSHYLQCAYSGDEQIYERTDDSFAQFGCEYNSTTALPNVSTDTETTATKTVHNGQILIHRNKKVYNMMGIEIK